MDSQMGLLLKIFVMFVLAFNRLPFCIKILIIKWKDEPPCAFCCHTFSVTIVHVHLSHEKASLAMEIVYAWAHTMGLSPVIQSITNT